MIIYLIFLDENGYFGFIFYFDINEIQFEYKQIVSLDVFINMGEGN